MPHVPERRMVGKDRRKSVKDTEVLTLIWTLQAVVVRMQDSIDKMSAEVFRIGTVIASGTTPEEVAAILNPVVDKLKEVK